MIFRILNSGAYLQNLVTGDDAQDLIEYALLVAMIGLAATAGLRAVADGLGNVFGALDTLLAKHHF